MLLLYPYVMSFLSGIEDVENCHLRVNKRTIYKVTLF